MAAAGIRLGKFETFDRRLNLPKQYLHWEYALLDLVSD